MVIRIKQLRLRTIIGVNEWERKKRQDLTINVEIHFDGAEAAESDDLEKSVDYKSLTKKIIRSVEGSSFFLLERLADHILEIIMQNQSVQAARVEVDKPHALRFADSASLEVSRNRTE
jgi:D-erythro-7,8-dihydroneopterin triphosphate epimerase